MSHYIEKVTVSLENLISELARNPSLFLKNPDTDFSRNRKINFKTCVGITMNSGGCTLNKELLDFFDFDVNAPTVSAYTQQRAKILPEAFEYLFHAFTEENAQTKNLYEGYQLLACDGSNLTIAPNLNDPETLWKSNQLGATGNHLHLNALYDVLNRTYIDALVQTASTYQEHRACIQMIERVTLDKVILIADEMYEMIAELPDYIVECLDEFISHYGTLEEVVEHKDDIYYYPDCETMTDVAYYYIDELQALGDIPPSLQNYIDYEAYGRDLDMGGCFIETSRGMCEIPY